MLHRVLHATNIYIYRAQHQNLHIFFSLPLKTWRL